ncbi:hypothetical protein FNV43_RR08457 [Rhamnella rubrinervis]|uniref:Uncharacterized protein n=1 Tax=Rhamnella rubrinervis TaxID=2594499 RepID=A0A8K0MIS7_9ROSA|nr:hypothetical protein FNV43_RR08457 [Rhamnella rubrinervis]
MLIHKIPPHLQNLQIPPPMGRHLNQSIYLLENAQAFVAGFEYWCFMIASGVAYCLPLEFVAGVGIGRVHEGFYFVGSMLGEEFRQENEVGLRFCNPEQG